MDEEEQVKIDDALAVNDLTGDPVGKGPWRDDRNDLFECTAEPTAEFDQSGALLLRDRDSMGEFVAEDSVLCVEVLDHPCEL